MNTRSWLAAITLLGVAACDGAPTRSDVESPPVPVGPREPREAQAASTGCPNRCGFVLPIPATLGVPRTLRLTESADVLGQYANTNQRFTWSLRNGNRVSTLALTGGAQPPILKTGNDWGQSLGVVSVPAGQGFTQRVAAWEPNGDLVFIPGANGALLSGRGEAMNDETVIVGTGAVDGDTWRPFRYNWRDGLRFLTPAGTRGTAVDVNSKGTIIGTWSEAVDPPTPAQWFIWTPAEGRKDMGTGTVPIAISETGWIIATSVTGNFVRSPEGKVELLPAGWAPIRVNHWGEVLLQARPETALEPGECGAAVWYSGYGLLKIRTPDAAYPMCSGVSINSWGDVLGSISRAIVTPEGVRDFEGKAMIWTWRGNETRYVQ